jgi:hypothetical protein
MASYTPEPFEKTDITHVEDGGVTDYAKRGQAATDQYGQTLTHFDPAVEARIRRKIDFNIVPIVAALYLFCFSESRLPPRRVNAETHCQQLTVRTSEMRDLLVSRRILV